MAKSVQTAWTVQREIPYNNNNNSKVFATIPIKVFNIQYEHTLILEQGSGLLYTAKTDIISGGTAYKG